MIPFGLSTKQFVDRFRGILDRQSPHVIAHLRSILSQPLPESVECAQVEIFIESDGYAAPSAHIYYDGTGKKIDRSDGSIFPGRGVELFDSIPGLNQFDRRYFTEPDSDGLNIAADVVKIWLSECWWKAGGWDYSISVQLSVHDDYGDGRHIELTPRQADCR